jgi:hypothetical protein
MRNLIHATLIAGLIGAPIAPVFAAKLSPEARLAQLTQGRVAGKPVSCINLSPVGGNNESENIAGLAIAYRQGTTWYVNRFDGGCPRLDEDTIVVTRLHSSQLCRGDVADLRMSGANIPVGTCIFGDFVPYTKE